MCRPAAITPSYQLRRYEREGIHIDCTEEDKQALAQGTVDFISFSYYRSTTVSTDPNAPWVAPNSPLKETLGVKNPYLKATDWGWAIDPMGLRIALDQVYDRYQKPILIAENGLGALDVREADGSVNDDYRIEYLKKHIEAMHDAVAEDGGRSDGLHYVGADRPCVGFHRRDAQALRLYLCG